MIDTGSSVNIIKITALNSSTILNKNKVFNLSGIGADMITTLGEVILLIKRIETSFQVADKNFPIEHEGILGTPFLRQQGGSFKCYRRMLSFR